MTVKTYFAKVSWEAEDWDGKKREHRNVTLTCDLSEGLDPVIKALYNTLVKPNVEVGRKFTIDFMMEVPE